jgi:ABC-type uncharacterized transport system involved in gliding motility auxiliary subunit
VGRNYLIANAVLWAAAVVAAAIVGAPTVLTFVLLPSLGFVSVLLTWRAPGKGPGTA